MMKMPRNASLAELRHLGIDDAVLFQSMSEYYNCPVMDFDPEWRIAEAPEEELLRDMDAGLATLMNSKGEKRCVGELPPGRSRIPVFLMHADQVARYWAAFEFKPQKPVINSFNEDTPENFFSGLRRIWQDFWSPFRSDETDSGHDSQIIQLVDKILLKAAEDQAQQVLIVSASGDMAGSVFFNLDGCLRTVMKIPSSLMRPTLGRLNIMIGGKMSWWVHPQEGLGELQSIDLQEKIVFRAKVLGFPGGVAGRIELFNLR